MDIYLSDDLLIERIQTVIDEQDEYLIKQNIFSNPATDNVRIWGFQKA